MSNFLVKLSKQALPCACISIFLSSIANAHHSFFGRFDTSASIQVEGKVTEILWRNPHVRMILEVNTPEGEMALWDIESGSPTLMQRAGIKPNSIRVGDSVHLNGYPPLTDRKEMFATNALLENGQELVLQTGAKAVFSKDFLGDFSYRFRTEGDRSHPEWGIFRVWTFTGADGFLFPESINRDYDLSNYPMKPVAIEALARHDPSLDNPTNNCQPKGMPLIMEQPLPMAITKGDGVILIRMEEYDLTRIIHMDDKAKTTTVKPSLLGFSIGHFEGKTLYVTTTNISYPYFNQSGIPLSKEATLHERFTAIDDGSKMNYELTVIDPINFTKPVELKKTWIHVPSETILPFDCLVSPE
jgi:hypothetical protein